LYGFWCNEKTLLLALMSFLRQHGLNLILGGKPGDMHIYFSKSDLVKGGARLSKMAVQGRNYIDFVAYNEKELVLGIVISRAYVMVYKHSEKHLRTLLHVLLSHPEDAENAYKELKSLGFDINSTNIAKLYKIYIAARSMGRIKRVYDAVRRVRLGIVTPCLGIDIGKAIVTDAIEKLIYFVMKEHNEDKVLSYEHACFRPVDVYKNSPTVVELRTVNLYNADEALLSGQMNFVELMGFEYLGCAKCNHLTTCIGMIRQK